MKINVSKVPEGGMNLRLEKDGAWFRDYLPEKGPVDFTLQGIDCLCAVRRLRETVFVTGSLSASAEAPCCRCLEPARLPLAASFSYTFSPMPAEGQAEVELSAEDLEVAYYEEDTIDLDRVLYEQLLLHVPIKPLCGEACRGLCPRCGTNLNIGSCRCEEEPFDGRLAVLKKFKVNPEKAQ